MHPSQSNFMVTGPVLSTEVEHLLDRGQVAESRGGQFVGESVNFEKFVGEGEVKAPPKHIFFVGARQDFYFYLHKHV